MSYKKAVVSLFLMLVMVFGSTPSAFAQSGDAVGTGIVATSWVSTSTTTTLGIAVPVGGIILTVVLVKRSQEESAAVESYINNNAVAIEHDLYMGGGESARDLAQLLAIPAEEFDAFAQALFENRHALLGLLESGRVDDRGAARFIEIVLGSMPKGSVVVEAS